MQQLSDEDKKSFSTIINSNPLFSNVMRELEEDAVTELVNCKPEDNHKRLSIQEKIKVIRDLRHELTRHSKKDNNE